MENQKKDYISATPEMVDRIIEEHYAADFSKMDLLLNRIAAVNKPEIDIEKIVAETIAGREKLVRNVSLYEDELVRMLDLANVILEHRSTKNYDIMDGYINYLLEKTLQYCLT